MKKLSLLIFIFICFRTMAQESNPIVTDRPTQSAASLVVPKGKLLAEYGYIYEEQDNIANVTYANLLIRYGLLNGVELRVTQNYQGEAVNITNEFTGFSPTTIGTKIHLLSEDGWIPQMSMIGQVTLTNGEAALSPTTATPEFRLNFSNTLSDKLSLGYNLGIGIPEEQPYTLYTLVLGYAFADGWSYFIEPYGFFQDNESDNRINSGFIYLVSDRFQVDFSGGLGLSEASHDFFIGFGAALGF